MIYDVGWQWVSLILNEYTTWFENLVQCDNNLCQIGLKSFLGEL